MADKHIILANHKNVVIIQFDKSSSSCCLDNIKSH